jgi:uncharacterized protein YdaU (DUF1376 family)
VSAVFIHALVSYTSYLSPNEPKGTPMAAPKTNDFYIRFNTSNFLAGTSWMSPLELGIYIRLYAKYWTEGRKLISDLTKLARNCGFGEEHRAELEFVLSEFFVLSEDRSTYHHPGLDDLSAENEALRDKRRRDGQKGAAAKKAIKEASQQAAIADEDDEF